ncbi:sigma-54 interaction domain-containing protein [Ureibacillus manganicus]|uniref:Transcriptional regulator n=1 Tax=Ureibacillus manganicus DSM 26584 TaxID=1384049 RepID=A0A0A3I714_9BACL|nr:sigma-54-dependent Fis family transcriptional regulator [Ureibacillus manganicus]KGR80514.1 transcriptional regulator [Ureibacillus manganicus DSM 26584]
MGECIKNLSPKVIEQILETSFSWFVVVDKNARIIYINKEYCDFLEVERENVIGKYVGEVIENSEMHLVIEKGVAQIAAPHYIKGNYMLPNRIPIYVDGEIVGAFGSVMFRDVNDWKKLNSHVQKTLEKIDENMKSTMESLNSLPSLIGSSNAIRKIKETISIIAPTKLPVLIEGEIGSGKELCARSIHHLSDRYEKPFVNINCSIIPIDLLEVELFGKWDGTNLKKGRLSLADGGTIYIQEINELPFTIQAKLLKMIQEGTIQPVGTDHEISINTRVLVSSNIPLLDLVKAKKFREDLFYRIQSITLLVPPLRERIEDLPELIQTFINKFCAEAGRRTIKVHRKVLWALQNYDWPGNVRELQNIIQAIVHLADGEEITEDSLPFHLRRKPSNFIRSNGTLEEILSHVEGQVIKEYLEVEKDKNKIAEQLGISRSTLYEKIKKHNL